MNRQAHLLSRLRRQHGAAILTALLLMALVATLSTAALWQQARAYDLEASERTRVQAHWILQGTTDWARLILREDARSGGQDHLGEPWAITLQEAKLSTFLAQGAVGDDALATDALHNAYLSGHITDLQSRLNVNNLLLDRQPHAPTLRAFDRLFDALQIPQSELQAMVVHLRASQPAPPGNAGAAATAEPLANSTPLMARSLEQLQWLGLSKRSIAVLQPYVTVLPERTTVNLNTAPLQVLQAIAPGLDASSAQRLIERRAQSHFHNLAEAAKAAGLPDNTFSDQQHGVGSRFFVVRTRLRIGAVVTQERTVVQRDGLLVKPLWKDREVPRDASLQ